MNNQNYADIINALNNTRMSVLVILAIVVLVALVMWYLSRRAAARAAVAAEEAKAKRAKDYVEGQRIVAAAIDQHFANSAAQQEMVFGQMKSMNRTLRSVNHVLGRLADRIEGRLTRDASIKLVSRFLADNVVRDITDIIAKSLTENDYDNRREYVARNIRTRIAAVLKEARDTLSEYPLAIDIAPFFAVDTRGAGIERFVLCDSVWEKVEPLYRNHAIQLSARIAEASLFVRNAVDDALSASIAFINESPNGGYRNLTTPADGVTVVDPAEAETDTIIRPKSSDRQRVAG